MSDAQLDAAFDAAMRAGDTALGLELADAIVMRMSSITGFVGSLIGGSSDFPLYEARTGFKAGEAARTSVSEQATAVGSSIASGMGSITAPLIILGLIAAYIVYKVKT